MATNEGDSKWRKPVGTGSAVVARATAARPQRLRRVSDRQWRARGDGQPTGDGEPKAVAEDPNSEMALGRGRLATHDLNGARSGNFGLMAT
uniref:Uncharacterized protein n=1 Tax=Oryza punctata TaxID=4537 RepID=A0A0E0K3E1_ORYPU